LELIDILVLEQSGKTALEHFDIPVLQLVWEQSDKSALEHLYIVGLEHCYKFAVGHCYTAVLEQIGILALQPA